MRRLDGSSWIQICDIVVIIGVTLTSAYGEDIRKWFLVLPILEYHNLDIALFCCLSFSSTVHSRQATVITNAVNSHRIKCMIHICIPGLRQLETVTVIVPK